MRKIIQNNFLWNEHKINIPSKVLLTNAFIKHHINNFWTDIVLKITDTQHILLLVRIQYIDDSINTLCTLQKLNKNDIKYIIKLLTNKIQMSQDEYLNKPIKNIIFGYVIRDGKINNKINVLNN